MSGLGDERRLAELEDAILRLRSDAEGALVVVEGRHDRQALEAMGVGGEVRLVQGPGTVETFIDAVAEEAAGRRVIVLVDWDRTGGRLFRRIMEGLRARVVVDGDHRRRIARACHAKALEDVPADLASLRRRTEAQHP